MYVYVCKDDKKRTIRFKDNYLNLEGVTASLRIGATNFIMHYQGRADEEWVCDQRDQIIETLVNQYKIAAGGNKPLPLFGVASQSLADYLTSEKDIARKICRMPTEEFLL